MLGIRFILRQERDPDGDTEIEENTNELYEKYNKELIDMVTKKLDETSSDIAKKMTNASYVYMMKNGTQILDTTLNSIESSIAKTNLTQNVLKIALFCCF